MKLPPHMRKILGIVIALAAIAGIVRGGSLAVQRKKLALAKAPKYEMLPAPVRTATARQDELVPTRSYLAVVEPIRVASVSARLTAAIEKVVHYEGEQVKEGDALVSLDSRQLQESVASTQAQVQQAQADLAANEATVSALARTLAYLGRESERDNTLVGKGVIPSAQAEGTAERENEARGRLDAARQKSSAIERLIESLKRKQAEAETQLSYCTIRSPFDGIVSLRLVDPGDMAVPGKDLVVIEDRARLKLSFDVPQQDLPEVREGMEVRLAVHGRNRAGTLSHLYPSLNVARMLRAEVYVAGSEAYGLSAGAYVSLDIVLSRLKDAVLVPASSIIESPDGTAHVFVADNGQLDARPVKLLGSAGDDVAVEGVDAGTKVVESTFLGWAQLSSGQKVEVAQ